MKLAAFTGVLLALLAVPTPEARADDAVVVLVTETTGPVALRVRAELESMGFHVALRRGDSREVPVGAVAIARLVERPPRIEIDALGEAQSSSRQTLTFDAPENESAVGSVLIAERVRAAFQPLAPRPTPAPEEHERAPTTAAAATIIAHASVLPVTAAAPPGDVAARAEQEPGGERARRRDGGVPAMRALAPDVADTAARPEHPSTVPIREPIGIGFAPAFQLGAGQVGLATYLGLYASVHERVRLEGFVGAPGMFFMGTTISSGDSNSATVLTGIVGGSVTATAWSQRVSTLGDHRQTFALLVGAGAAGTWVRAEGTPTGGYVGKTEDALAALLFGSLGLRIESPWSRRLFFTPRVFAGATVPTIDIQFDGRKVATWGAPWAMFAGTVEIDVGAL